MIDRYYIGHTEDLNKRLARHNNSRVFVTKYGVPCKFYIQNNIPRGLKRFGENEKLKITKAA